MQEPGIDLLQVRHDLKAKRKVLFANFLKDPSDTRLALEIRLLDDLMSRLDTELSKEAGTSRAVEGHNKRLHLSISRLTGY